LSRNNNTAAQETTHLIAENELLLQDPTGKQQHLEQHETNLKQLLHSSVKQIEQYRRELRMVQATQSAQIAVERISSSDDLLPRRIGEMKVSLTRIREQQQCTADRLQAEKLVAHEFPGENPVSSGDGVTPEAVTSVLDRLQRRIVVDTTE